MIDLKEAIDKAQEFIMQMYGLGEQLQVEEAILSPDKKSWSVTLSYFNKIKAPNELQKVLGLQGTKEFKRVVIDSENRSVIGLFNKPYDRSEAA
ncbi:MAG TPA: hypothetical protein VGO50_18285 [Pyrinomonadaceae bacterium]|jgi:hypothetical protein|nr:hypothetical protein [Pyrinomonadaceae bacterium]